jgi:hypothetical protein
MREAKSGRDRFAWLAAVMARVSPRQSAARSVATGLFQRFNHKTGLCYPGIQRIAADVNLHPNGVRLGRSVLREQGWLAWSGGGGRGRTTEYHLLMDRVDGIPDSEGKTLHHGGGFTPAETLQCGSQIPPANGEKPSRLVEVNKGNQKNNQNVADELRVSDEEGAGTPRDILVVFERLWLTFRRKEAKRLAWREFERIVTSGEATIQRLQTAALSYAHQNREVAPRYTERPDKWLRDGRWEDSEQAPQSAPRSSPELIEGEDPRWTDVKRQLFQIVGAPKFEARLAPIAFGGIADDEVKLFTETGQSAKRITADFGTYLLSAWQAVVPSVRKVSVTARERSAAA